MLMGDVNVLDVVANVSTGGLWGAGKSAADVITGKTDILSGTKDAFNTLGPWGGVMMPIDKNIAQAGNIAGATAGLLSGGMAGVTPSGFGTAGAEGATTAADAATVGANLGTATSAETQGVAGSMANAPVHAQMGNEAVMATGPSDLSALQTGPVTQANMGPVSPPGADWTTGVDSTFNSGYAAGQGPPSLNPTSALDPTSAISNSVDSSIANAGQSFSMIPEGAGQAATQSWWAAQPAAVKAALVGGGLFAGGQLATGAMGGYFQGLSAQKKLELEQLINQQRQNQVQYLNKNNQYTPLLKFTSPPGPTPSSSILNTNPLKGA